MIVRSVIVGMRRLSPIALLRGCSMARALRATRGTAKQDTLALPSRPGLPASGATKA